VNVVVNPRAPHQVRAGEAIAEGIRSYGAPARITEHPAGDKTVVCWGWRKGKAYRQMGHDVLVMEHGYIGDRHEWTSLGWNGLNNRARFAGPGDGIRFHALFHHLLEPWRNAGRYVLLIGQVPGDMSLGGRDLTRWYEITAQNASRHYGLPVVFRPHPVAVERGQGQAIQGANLCTRTLQDSLADAAVVITWNSNTAVESVLAGIPTLTFDEGSMAWTITGHEIGDERTPDREQWANRVAWCQWSEDEMRNGSAFEHVMRAKC